MMSMAAPSLEQRLPGGMVRSSQQGPPARVPAWWWGRQLAELRAGGWRAAVRKARTLLETLLAVPVVLLMRLARPLVWIRVGAIPSSRVGPFAANIEIYLCERDARLHGSRVVDLFYHALPVCNRQLQAMWDRVLPVGRFVGSLARVNQWFPVAKAHEVPMRRPGDRDLHGLLAVAAPHLAFTDEECRRGRTFLQERGIHEGMPYVCFQAREAVYLSRTYPDRGWGYHGFRNTDVRSMLPAVAALADRGYAALRVGAIVEAPLRLGHPRVLDYASSGRTDFLDIFLGAHCRFYLGDSSGFLCIPEIFRRPLAIVNIIPLEYAHSWGPHDLFIPKRLWLRAERRWLTFREILESGIGRTFQRTDQYEAAGLDVVDNTPEEITALALEMDARLSQTWQAAPEDEELQRRFWALFAGSPLHGVIRARVGAAFLRQQAHLLEP